MTDVQAVQAERVRTLVLLRLLTKRAPSAAQLKKSVAAWLPGTRPQANELVEAALAQCVAKRLAHESPLTLTDEGRSTLRAALGGEALPAPGRWDDLCRKVVIPLVFGSEGTALRPAKSARRKPDAAEQLAAAILAKRFGLSGRDSLRATVDRVAWQALGVDSNAPFDAGRVQRHLLRELVPEDARVDLKAWRKLLAVKSVGAARGDANGLRKAVLARWLQGEATLVEPKRGSPVSKPDSPSRAHDRASTDNDNAGPSDDLGILAEAVVRGAQEPGVSRFQGDRAFIASIWEHMRGRAPVDDMSLADFKQRLVAAHQAGLLRMTRAELVGAMDPGELTRSEAKHAGTTFHFVALDAAGGR